MGEATWLCPTELDRSRVVEASDRVHTIRRVGSITVGIALIASAPWIGWWTLILLAASTVNFANVERRIYTSPRPERVSMFGIIVTLILLGGGIAYSGGPRSPLLPWIVLPAGMAAARFRPQVVEVGLGVSAAAIFVVTFGVHPGWTVANPAPVIAVLALLVTVVSIVWALQAAELYHRGEAVLDQLTGLLNRNALLPRFQELTQQARLTNSPICLVLCDLDNFKQVNDTHGHDVGDDVLRDVAYELRKVLRSFELAYRLGGEEFLIVLPGIHLQGGAEIAERLREAVEQSKPGGVHVTVSIGLSAGRGEDVDYDSLFKAADSALYEAKRAGRNRVAATERRDLDVDGRRSDDNKSGGGSELIGADGKPAAYGPPRLVDRA